MNRYYKLIHHTSNFFETSVFVVCEPNNASKCAQVNGFRMRNGCTQNYETVNYFYKESADDLIQELFNFKKQQPHINIELVEIDLAYYEALKRYNQNCFNDLQDLKYLEHILTHKT